MLKYIISCLLCTLFVAGNCQQTDFESRNWFIRPGVDLSRFVVGSLNNYQYKAFELSIDTEVKYKYFPILEAGYTKINDVTKLHNYSLSGNYYRLGLDYNMIEYRHRLDRNMFFVGARYSIAMFGHKADSILLENPWGQYNYSVDNNNLLTHWVEGVIGLRGEVFTNFFMGVTIRVKYITYKTDFSGINPQIIPGFGRGNKNSAIGLSYSVYYAIPIKKATR